MVGWHTVIGQGSQGLLDLGANYFVSDQSSSSLQLGSDELRIHPPTHPVHSVSAVSMKSAGRC